MSVRATISDSKADFHKEFPYVIPAIYRKLADELLVELHLLSHQKNFKINVLFCSGLKEIFDTFTNGYKPQEHTNKLFNAICNCNGFNPNEINSYSEDLSSKINSITKDTLMDYILTLKQVMNKDDYYSRINAIGIYKLVSSLPYHKNLDAKEIDIDIKSISDELSYPFSRVEKDISLYKSNIEKMKQALEIIALSLNSKK